MRPQAFDAMSFSAIQSLRTGSVVIDMALALFVTAACSFVFEGHGKRKLDECLAHLRRWLGGRAREECIRTLTHVTSRNQPCGLYGDVKNDTLQKALVLYLGHLGVKYNKRAQVALTSLQDANLMRYERPDRHNPLQAFRLTWLAPESEWVDIGKGVQFRQF